MESVELSEEEFKRRFLERFHDPEFAAVRGQIDEVAAVAWKSYIEYHKNPLTRKAGRGFADPRQDLPVEWLAARAKLRAAQLRQRRKAAPARILIVNGSPRTNQSCPGEASKTWRLARLAQKKIESVKGFEVDFLDLSRLTSEYGRVIFPCKSCVSTAMPLCHWPCSCYPNHALGQVRDWMNDIYPLWVAAHGVMIVSPVHWYQTPSTLKLMIDRLVCADGGNPDPTTTKGKDPERAKALELAGWHYPKHLAGRAFAVVVHGDAAGVDTLRRILHDWLTDMELIPAGPAAVLGRYLGYYRPYATSHDDLDADHALQAEVEHAALALVERVRQIRSGRYRRSDRGLVEPRKK
jgi:multimeric flavodoxin WrbA